MEIVWPRADTLVWLDPPRLMVMSRVIRRTGKRLLTREALWSGNRERLSNMIRNDPEENIILWAWTRHHHVRSEYEQNLSDGTWSHLQVHRLQNRDEIRVPRRPGLSPGDSVAYIGSGG
jgi:hypothetical protein